MASLIYRKSSRLAKTIQWDLVLKNILHITFKNIISVGYFLPNPSPALPSHPFLHLNPFILLSPFLSPVFYHHHHL